MGTRDDIKQITRALQCACQNNEANVALLSNIETLLGNISITLNQANWTSIVGNSVDYTYDAITNNVTIAEYYTGATLVFTQTYTYDPITNNCTNITTT